MILHSITKVKEHETTQSNIMYTSITNILSRTDRWGHIACHRNRKITLDFSCVVFVSTLFLSYFLNELLSLFEG
jgi:hypothetical protein